MSTTGNTLINVNTRSVQIDSNLSDKSGYAVNWDASDENVVNIAADATKFPMVLCDDGDGSTTQLTGSVYLPGSIVEVKLGGTVAAGDKLTSDGNGKWITTTTDTQHYGAIAQEGGDSNDLIEALVMPGMVAG